MTEPDQQKISELIWLSHEIGRHEHQMAILGEGNTSVKLGGGSFAVKASGAQLASLKSSDITVCQEKALLALLDRKEVTDEEIENILRESRARPRDKKPSVESMFHSWLLTLPGVVFVGHCHPVTVNQILCSKRAREFAERRIFPDEIVCCGPASVFVPYADPGLPLAQAIRRQTEQFISRRQVLPRLILLENHGLIALAGSASGVLASLMMANKAAAIFAGAALLGGPVFLPARQVRRIAGRSDEAYRQKQLKIQ